MPDTLTPPAPASGLQTREFAVRDVDTDARTVTGIAVPWDQEIAVLGYRESIAPGACEPIDNPKLFSLHRSAIGRLTAWEDTPEGWQITARISETPLGDEMYTLLRDGVIDRMSIGFEPVEHVESTDEDGTVSIRRTKVRVYEVSLVPFPAYDGAKVSDVRSAHPTTKENPVPDTLTTPAPTDQLNELRENVAELSRSVAALANVHKDEQPTVHYRSAAHLLKAMVAGDEAAIREYNDTLARAWDPAGAVVADGSRTGAGWVGDLTRFVDEAAVLAGLFSQGTLPAEGMTIEYGVLESDTTQVTKQTAEGADLAFGKVKTTTKNADIGTYGGYSRLSLQAVQRSSVNLLNHTLTALGLAAGKRRNAVYRSVFANAVSAQRTAGNLVTVADSTDYIEWLDAIVDAAEKYTDLGLGLEAMVVDKTVFKQLARLEGSDGRPLLTIAGTGTNVVGDLNVTAIQGNLASVPIRLNPKQATPGAAFVNKLAIREYRSPLARLQDENVVNLSQDFSVYFYAAHAVEIPEAIVPIEITA